MEFGGIGLLTSSFSSLFPSFSVFFYLMKRFGVLRGYRIRIRILLVVFLYISCLLRYTVGQY